LRFLALLEIGHILFIFFPIMVCTFLPLRQILLTELLLSSVILKKYWLHLARGVFNYILIDTVIS